MSEKDDGGPAFPESGLSGLPNGEFIHGRAGMTLRDYFIAHAPAEPPEWFVPKMPPKPDDQYSHCGGKNSRLLIWHNENEKQKWLQWPAAWADAMLEARQ